MADAEDKEEAPLDPAVEQVQARLRRLMMIAALTLGLGIFAVFAAIVYRLMSSEPAPPTAITADTATPTLSRSDLGVSEGATLVSSSLDGDQVALTYSEENGTIVVIFHLPSMSVTGRFRISD